MKIAVIQHRLRESAAADAAALVASAKTAAAQGAQITFLPEVMSLYADGQLGMGDLYAGLKGLDGIRLLPSSGVNQVGMAATAPPIEGYEEFGSIALFSGDTGITGMELVRILADKPSTTVLAPRSESDLQAEAVVELAIALSESLSGLVIVAECAGAEPTEVGHGGSAIIALGKVLAESLVQDDDILYAEIELPIAQPEPREALPVPPPILSQRVAVHRGEKPSVDYPADLS